MEESAAPDAVLGTLPGVDSEDPALQASLQQSLRDMQGKDSKTSKTQNDWQQVDVSADWVQLRELLLQWLTTATAVLCLRGVALRCAVLCYVVTRPSRAYLCKNLGSHKASSECKAIETNLTCQYDSRNFDE